MSKSFRTRKIGSLKQIGKKFPIFLKKTLPEKIRMTRSDLSQKVNWKKYADVKAILTFSTREQAQKFYNNYIEAGPEIGWTPPENIYLSGNKMIMTFNAFNRDNPMSSIQAFRQEIKENTTATSAPAPNSVKIITAAKGAKEYSQYIDKAIRKSVIKFNTKKPREK